MASALTHESVLVACASRHKWLRVVMECPRCRRTVFVRVAPWTLARLSDLPDSLPIMHVECELHHTVYVTAGDIRRAA